MTNTILAMMACFIAGWALGGVMGVLFSALCAVSAKSESTEGEPYGTANE